jgi:hypothetical protein
LVKTNHPESAMPGHNTDPAFRSIRMRNRMITWFPWLSRFGEIRQFLNAARRWRNEGWFVPVPHFVRRAMLVSQARAIDAGIFVETGTYKGGTTWCLLGMFRRIVTIEVVPELAALAKERFNGHSEVTVIEGDSASVLPDVCMSLDAPCLFYLDGHYSGGITGMGDSECPVIEELRVILTLAKVPFRIVIDDARLFGTDPAYPTVRSVGNLVKKHHPLMQVRVENDAILICGE